MFLSSATIWREKDTHVHCGNGLPAVRGYHRHPERMPRFETQTIFFQLIHPQLQLVSKLKVAVLSRRALGRPEAFRAVNQKDIVLHGAGNSPSMSLGCLTASKSKSFFEKNSLFQQSCSLSPLHAMSKCRIYFLCTTQAYIS